MRALLVFDGKRSWSILILFAFTFRRPPDHQRNQTNHRDQEQNPPATSARVVKAPRACGQRRDEKRQIYHVGKQISYPDLVAKQRSTPAHQYAEQVEPPEFRSTRAPRESGVLGQAGAYGRGKGHGAGSRVRALVGKTVLPMDGKREVGPRISANRCSPDREGPESLKRSHAPTGTQNRGGD